MDCMVWEIPIKLLSKKKKKEVVIPVPKPAGEVSTVQVIPPKHYAGYGAGYGGKSETI